MYKLINNTRVNEHEGAIIGVNRFAIFTES